MKYFSTLNINKDLLFIIIRTISDNADDHSEFDFPLFMKEVASRYSVEAIRRLLA